MEPVMVANEVILAASPTAHALTEGGAEGARGEAAPPSALPSQESDNCIEKKDEPLSPYRRKSRHRLIMAIEWMVKKHGLERVGLLTLTFGVPGSGRGSEATRELRELAKDLEFVQKRWHSLNSNIIRHRYKDWIVVLEPHKDGVWHIHVVVATQEDIRTGTDIETLTNYKLPYWMRRGKHLRNEALAKEWRELRQIACKYRFGRIELLPVKKTGEALARYVAGYLSKSFKLVPPGKKSRLVRMSRSISKNITMKFSPLTLGNLIYRTRLKMAADMLHLQDYGDFADFLGSRWNYYLGDLIAAIPIPLIFSKGHFESGVAAKLLNDFAENPCPYLDESTNKKMLAVNAALLEKFKELAFDEMAESRWQESQRVEADEIDLGPVTAADLQGELLNVLDNPFLYLQKLWDELHTKHDKFYI
jgi:hypothetical protein